MGPFRHLPAPPTNYSVGSELYYGDGALGSDLALMDRNRDFVFDPEPSAALYFSLLSVGVAVCRGRSRSDGE